MFGTVLTIVFSIFVVYILFRAVSIPFVKHSVNRKILFSFALLLLVFFFLARSVGHNAAGTLATMLDLAGMNLLGIVFIVTTVLFIVDFLTRPNRINQDVY